MHHYKYVFRFHYTTSTTLTSWSKFVLIQHGCEPFVNGHLIILSLRSHEPRIPVNVSESGIGGDWSVSILPLRLLIGTPFLNHLYRTWTKRITVLTELGKKKKKNGKKWRLWLLYIVRTSSFERPASLKRFLAFILIDPDSSHGKNQAYWIRW